MGSKKIYAVRVGRKTGIFKSWDECKKQIEGYSGAIYKSFTVIDDAKKFLDVVDEMENKSLEKEYLKAYVDGSYEDSVSMYSYGCAILDGENVIKLKGVGNQEFENSMRNVSGELLGALKAINWAIDNSRTSIEIYHDYIGIQAWADGDWKAKKPGTQKYIEKIKDARKKIKIKFVKVAAHTGDEYNEIADNLAKEAIKEFIYNGKKLNQIVSNMDEVSKCEFEELLSKGKLKYKIQFRSNDIELQENQIKKYILKQWENDGNDVNEIKSMHAVFNTESSVLEWSIENTKKDIIAHQIKLI